MALLRASSDLAALRDRPRRLLAVFPHPDDEAYGCAGALARAGRDTGTAVVLLCLTRGEASTVIGRERGLSGPEVGDLREGRLREVAAIVGLDGLVLPGLPDGRLARLSPAEVARPIGEVLDALRPQVVIAHDPRGVNAHADHVAAHWAVRHALLLRPPVRLAMLAYRKNVCEAARPRLLLPTREEELDVVLRLTEGEIDAKERCLRVHDAIVTLREPALNVGEGATRDAGPPVLLQRPADECYDLLGEEFDPPLEDLFGLLSVPG